MTKRNYECNLEQIDSVAKDISKALSGGGVLLLIGTLASGKTTLVKHIAKFLNINDDVSSPTFSLMQSYDDTLFHYDIYQCGLDGFLKQGLMENLCGDGVHVVEWVKAEQSKSVFSFIFFSLN